MYKYCSYSVNVATVNQPKTDTCSRTGRLTLVLADPDYSQTLDLDYSG